MSYIITDPNEIGEPIGFITDALTGITTAHYRGGRSCAIGVPLCDGCDRPLTNGYCVHCDRPAHTTYRLGLVRQAEADTDPLTKLRNMGEAA